MTWSDLEPYGSNGGGSNLGAVMLSASRADGRYRPVTIVTFRPRLWHGAAPAWLLGGTVNVQIGAGEHRGQLRITPKGRFPLGKVSSGVGMILRLPPLPGQKPGRQQPVACDYEFHDDWIEIDLPIWAKPAAAVPQPALSPDAAKKWGGAR